MTIALQQYDNFESHLLFGLVKWRHEFKDLEYNMVFRAIDEGYKFSRFPIGKGENILMDEIDTLKII